MHVALWLSMSGPRVMTETSSVLPPPLPVYDYYHTFCAERNDFYCHLCKEFSRGGRHERTNILHWMRLERSYDEGLKERMLQEAHARELREWIKKHSAPVAQVNE